MSDNGRIEPSVSFAVVLLVVGIILGWLGAVQYEERRIADAHRVIATVERPREDSSTIEIEVPIAPIEVHSKSNRQLRLEPSVDSSEPSIGSSERIRTYCLDTVLRRDSCAGIGDSLSICHTLPADSFFVQIHLAPRDTIAIVHFVARDSIILHRESVPRQQRAWYEEPLEILGSILAGFLLGSLRRL